MILTLFLANVAFAGEAAIRSAMQEKFPYSRLISVAQTPYLGLYEVVFDNQLVYTDEKMRYLFSGNIIDLRTMHNLTRAREREVYVSNFNNLPFELAIRNVKGNGDRKLAVFTDPNCQYCKKLEREMADLNNATVYIFMISILPGSEDLTKAVWCSPDRLKAWESHMLSGTTPAQGISCDTAALATISMHAKELGINVTPTLVFEDGSIRPGTLTLELLNQQLAASRMTD